MSASALMQIGQAALFASYRQVQTSANNIANANTEGYSRQSVQLQTTQGQRTGDGYIGRGVTVTTVTRAANSFYTDKTNALASAAGTDSARADLLKQMEKVFGQGESGMGYAATQIYSAYADLAAAPADLSARQAVLGRLEDFASLSRATNQQVDDLRKQVQYDLQSSVSEVNGMARDLAQLNVQITDAAVNGHQPNDLLDQRDLLISRISSLTEVHSVMGPHGEASLFVASGETLVLGNRANTLVTMPDEVNPDRLNMGIHIDGGLTLLSRAVTGEGRIAGLLRFQNDDLAAARNKLGQLVTGVASTLNKQQTLGLDLTGTAGSALFNITPPQVVPATTNAKDASGAYVSSMAIDLVDPSALQASDYEVVADSANPGSFTVTRQSDGVVRSGVVSGDVVDGFRLSVGSTAPSGGERFLFRPVAGAPGALEVALRNPLGLAAANPVTAAADASNVGTLAVASLTVNEPPASGYAALTLSFTNSAGDYEIRDASGGLLTSGSYTAGQPVVYDGMALQLSGLPQAGDRINIAPTVYVGSSNGNALTMQTFGEQRLVGGQTAAESFAALLSDVGVRTQSAVATAGNTVTALQQAKAQLTGEVGVNLDEEAARLIQYQQGYQAAAKVLQTAQGMLDTVLQISGR